MVGIWGGGLGNGRDALHMWRKHTAELLRVASSAGACVSQIEEELTPYIEGK